jgi:hypothetical protein
VRIRHDALPCAAALLISRSCLPGRPCAIVLILSVNGGIADLAAARVQQTNGAVALDPMNDGWPTPEIRAPGSASS